MANKDLDMYARVLVEVEFNKDLRYELTNSKILISSVPINYWDSFQLAFVTTDERYSNNRDPSILLSIWVFRSLSH